MALQLLLETSGGLSGIRSVESACIFSGQKTTYVLLPHSIVFLDVRIDIAGVFLCKS
jgi:hypothetical protein